MVQNDESRVKRCQVLASGLVNLRDPVTHNLVQALPPDPAHVALDVVKLEEMVRQWCNLLTQTEAAAKLNQWGTGQPMALLHGLSWLIATRHAICAARTGKNAYEGIKSMDYVGPWRRTGTPEQEKTWKTLNYIVHQGAIAALTGEPKVFSAFEDNATQFPEMWKHILHHMLVLIDGFTQDMARLDLPPWGWAALLTGKTEARDSDWHCG